MIMLILFVVIKQFILSIPALYLAVGKIGMNEGGLIQKNLFVIGHDKYIAIHQQEGCMRYVSGQQDVVETDRITLMQGDFMAIAKHYDGGAFRFQYANGD